MARVIVTALADRDTKQILTRIEREAGHQTAVKFNLRFEALYDRLVEHPEICEARPKLGPHIRAGVVFPYLVIYRHVEGDEIVSIVRVVHGHRRITRNLLRGS